MRTTLMALLAVFTALSLVPGSAVAAEKQPVFLICPHKKRYSAWSVYVVADGAKLTKVGLDKLTGVNSEDLDPDGFANALKKHQDLATPREDLGTIDAAQFGTGKIEIKKDDALEMSVSDAGNGAYRLELKMRCTSDKYWKVGGKDVKKQDIILKQEGGKWYACAQKMIDSSWQDFVGGGCKKIIGINFPVTGTGIYSIIGVFDDGPRQLVDGWKKPEE